MGKLKGKVAVVTGASKGIGAAIAKRFGKEGAAVVVSYASDRHGADQVVEDIVRNGGNAIVVRADVSKAADVHGLFDETERKTGPIDVLVNNAGIFDFQPIEDVTEQEFHRQFNTNVLGLILATQHALKHFNRNGGSIINVSSIASKDAVPNSVVYGATKGAVDAITRVLAKELGARKIRVNAIAPGGVETEGVHRIGLMGSDFQKQVVEATPLGRFGQPDDIARVATFLASDDSGWVTGERIVASGGFH